MPNVGRYWILTIPGADFSPPYKPAAVQWIRGQLERGDGGYVHWQLVAAFPKNVRLAAVKRVFGDTCHAELTRSDAAIEYVWKELTRIENTQFELGERLLRRNDKRDWQSIWDAAKSGRLEDIDVAARVQHYRTIKQIATDHLIAPAMERTVHVFWGTTGTGKSRRAWAEAGADAYPKDPRTKFWCGYQGGANVVIDEFRGGIDISHLLRWFDRYPVLVEIKGGATVLRATTIWITSNISPREWYPTLDDGTKEALLRRLTVTHFDRMEVADEN